MTMAMRIATPSTYFTEMVISEEIFLVGEKMAFCVPCIRCRDCRSQKAPRDKVLQGIMTTSSRRRGIENGLICTQTAVSVSA